MRKLPMCDADPSERFVADLTEVQGQLFAYIVTLVPDADRARDVLQETNLVLWRKRGEFKRGSNFEAWVCTVAKMQARAAWRDQSRERGRLLFDDAVLDILDDASKAHPHLGHRRRDALRSCMANLPADQRELIRKRYEGRGDVAEIASSMDRSANAVSISLHRIRKRLMACIERTLGEGDAA